MAENRNIIMIFTATVVGAFVVTAGVTDWRNQHARSERQQTAERVEPLSMTAPRMPSGADMPPPPEYVEACRVQGCTNYSTSPIIPWTKAVRIAANKALAAARQRNPRVNRPVKTWQVPETGVTTNCVGCSRSMQRDLQSLFPAFEAAFRLAITTKVQDGPNGESYTHMVLTIESTEGTFACDCNYSHCLPFDRVTTRWSRREGTGGNWVKFQGES